MTCEYLCEFVLTRLGPEEGLLFTETWIKLTVPKKWCYIPESFVKAWDTCSQGDIYGFIASTRRN